MPVGGYLLIRKDEDSQGPSDAQPFTKWGTVGGGAIERQVIQSALAYLDNGVDTALIHYDLTGAGTHLPDVVSVPMICGGQVSVFYQVYRPEPLLLIFGSGNVGSALYQKMSGVGFRRIVCDPVLSQEVASVDHQPHLEAALQELGAHTYVVIATGDHQVDAHILEQILLTGISVAYLGMLASKKKMATIRQLLEAKGIEHWPRIYSPIGLSLGGPTPEEIAIAIAAQLIATRHGQKYVEDMDL